MQPLHQDVLSTLEFVMLHDKHTWSSVLAIASSWMEQSAHFLQRARGSGYIHVEPVQEEGNFKLKK
jgi:hypothetical protein